MPGLERHARMLSDQPRCLIQGYVCPRNAVALRQFLKQWGIRKPRITAIDLFNLPAIYKRLKLSMPKMQYILADAANLAKHFADDSMDVIVQDFLLNCAPHSQRQPILDEVGRVLSPNGFALISYTDNHGQLKRLNGERAAEPHEMGLAADARHMGDAPSVGPGRWLIGSIIADRVWKGHVVVMPPHGRLEFYTDQKTIGRAFKRAKLNLLAETITEAVDFSGQFCRRHHCFLAANK
jgi:SAM-dependent methyltransferase